MTALAERSAEIANEIEAARAELVEVEQEAAEKLETIAGEVALKLVTKAEGGKRRAAVERDLDERRERLAFLQDALPDIERRRLAEEEEARQAELRVAAGKLDKALQARASAGNVLARALREADGARAELERHRGVVDEKVEAYTACLRAAESFQWPRGAPVDEPWEPPEGLAEFVDAGPIRPLADQEEALAQVRATREQQDRETLQSFALQPTESLMRTLPERLHPQAEKILAEHRAKAEEQCREREERDARRRYARVGEERSRPHAPVA